MPDKIFIDSINDIYNSIKYIKDFTADLDFNQFEEDFKTQYAVIRCFEIIGEAVKRLPEIFREEYPDVPWQVMAGMRDRLIHGYDMVDVGILWRTIKADIMPLFEQILKIRKVLLND